MNREKVARAIRYYRYKLFPRNQRSFPVALSIFLGVWIGVMPTIGIAIALTILICKIIRIPIIPGVTASFIANPATQFPFFYPGGYAIGTAIVDPPPFEFLSIFQKISQGFSITELSSYGETLGGFASLATQNTHHFVSFMVGMTVLSTIIGGVCFFAALYYMENLKKNRFNAKGSKR
ncbi:MAG: DUF2062 domain-containing protein [Fibrobacterales bacterium]